MTEFETASLAYAALSSRSTFAYAVVSLIVGAAQCVPIRIGIRAMQRAGDRRAREQDQRHDEAMTALKALIARTGGPGPSTPPSAA